MTLAHRTDGPHDELYSVAMTLWVVPHVAWCLKGTAISILDIARTLQDPFFAGAAASAAAVIMHVSIGSHLAPIVELVLGGTLMFPLYPGILMFALGEKDVYFGLVRTLLKGSTGPLKPETAIGQQALSVVHPKQ